MWHLTNNVLPLYSTSNKFCTTFWRVFHWCHIPCQTFFNCHRFPNRIVTNWIWLFLQCGIWPLCVVNNWHIVPINQRRYQDWHSHHAQLVFQSPECFHTNIHRNKFRSKHWSLNSCLLIGQPRNWSIVQ